MKIERKEASFQPITITLESQEEVDVISSVFGKIGGRGKVRTEIIDKLYYAIESHATPNSDDRYFEGELFLK